MRVGVVIATLGRPAELEVLSRRLLNQTLAPALIIYSVTREEDLFPAARDIGEVLIGTPGLCAQRNRGLEAILDRCDVVAFFDDDYVPSKRCIEGIATVFKNGPDIAGASGTLLDDGVVRGGISPADAERLVDAFDQEPLAALAEKASPDGLYGCNMAFRLNAIRSLRFDEALPLYGWQEDTDFSVRAGENGRLVRSNAFVGVHCGVTKARSPGLRMGYAQIANPIYLVRKGTMQKRYALRLMIRNALANHGKMFFPEPWMDRKGRVKGNWVAILDLLTGKLSPKRILTL